MSARKNTTPDVEDTDVEATADVDAAGEPIEGVVDVEDTDVEATADVDAAGEPIEGVVDVVDGSPEVVKRVPRPGGLEAVYERHADGTQTRSVRKAEETAEETAED